MSTRQAADIRGKKHSTLLTQIIQDSVAVQMQHLFLKNIQPRQKDKKKPHISKQVKMENMLHLILANFRLPPVTQQASVVQTANDKPLVLSTVAHKLAP